MSNTNNAVEIIEDDELVGDYDEFKREYEI